MHFLSHSSPRNARLVLTGVISSLDKMLETTVIFLLFFSHFGGAYNIDTTEPVKWTSRPTNGFFGVSVALSKDNVYVGAPNDDTHGNVYNCTKSGSSCSIVGGKPIQIFV